MARESLEASFSRMLLNFRPVPTRPRWPRGFRPMRVLHLLSQQPAKTGSGVALMAMVHYGAQKGHHLRAVIGLPGDVPVPRVPPLGPGALFPVRFDAPPLDFPIPGMSDVMPHPSTLFSSFTDAMREAYLRAFWEALDAAAEGFSPDIVHSNHLWLLTALARVRFPDTPICVSSHGTELRQLEKAPRLAPFVLPACAAVNQVFALHEENKRMIAHRYGISRDSITVVGAGFRSELFRPAAEESVSPTDRGELVIVYAGKISRPKGVPWLVEAMGKIRIPRGKTVRLLLAGSAGNDDEAAIRRQAAGNDRIAFLGPLGQETLAGVLQRADVFVLPSFYEGLPLAVVEAMACGCRVVMTDLPGIDTWMPKGLCEKGWVEKVPLPSLVDTDRPVDRDLPRFVERLADALSIQLERAVSCRGNADMACQMAPFSWKGIFDHIDSVYGALAGT